MTDKFDKLEYHDSMIENFTNNGCESLLEIATRLRRYANAMSYAAKHMDKTDPAANARVFRDMLDGIVHMPHSILCGQAGSRLRTSAILLDQHVHEKNGYLEGVGDQVTGEES